MPVETSLTGDSSIDKHWLEYYSGGSNQRPADEMCNFLIIVIRRIHMQTGYPSIDKPWLKYYDRDFSESEIPNLSIYQLAIESNKNNMRKIAIDLRSSVTNYSVGIKITYEEFFERIQETAKASYALGIQKREIIPIILPNIPEARILIYSNSILGAVSYPISPLLPANQLKDLIDQNGVKKIFIFKMFLPKYLEV